jgi:hypothetical protein
VSLHLIACREVAKHFECPYGTGASITPDGVIVMADGTVLALDFVVGGTGDKAQETAWRKRFGWGSLGALERALRRLAGRRILEMMRCSSRTIMRCSSTRLRKSFLLYTYLAPPPAVAPNPLYRWYRSNQGTCSVFCRCR